MIRFDLLRMSAWGQEPVIDWGWITGVALFDPAKIDALRESLQVIPAAGHGTVARAA